MVKEEHGRKEAGYAEKRKEEQRGGGTRERMIRKSRLR